MSLTTEIFLRDVRIYAYHGVLSQEKKLGTYYLINARIGVDVSLAMSTDSLDDTLNYAQISDLIHQEMAQPSDLLERVLGRILNRMQEEFPQIDSIDISLEKQNPPMPGEMAGVGVKVKWTKNK